MAALVYPAWLRIDHWLNVQFLTLLLRGGIEILSTQGRCGWPTTASRG